jgi:hypothetical protein
MACNLCGDQRLYRTMAPFGMLRRIGISPLKNPKRGLADRAQRAENGSILAR